MARTLIKIVFNKSVWGDCKMVDVLNQYIIPDQFSYNHHCYK